MTIQVELSPEIEARLVAAMQVHAVPRILTFNTRDFARFSRIEAVHPADLA